MGNHRGTLPGLGPVIDSLSAARAAGTCWVSPWSLLGTLSALCYPEPTPPISRLGTQERPEPTACSGAGARSCPRISAEEGCKRPVGSVD